MLPRRRIASRASRGRDRETGNGMAIGSINRGGGYTIGGRPLGVQLGQKNAASELFGGANGIDSILSANIQGSSGITVDKNQIVLKAMQDEIDRTLGYRTNLSVAEKQKLADLQQDITDIEEITRTRRLTSEEVKRRADLYVQSYKILGKDYVDVENDDFLKAKTAELDELIATKPKGADARRLEQLRTLKERLEQRVYDRGDKVSESLLNQIRSVNRQISGLTTPRKLSTFTPAERRQHDELVDEINDHAGQELILPSEKKLKIERLQQTMEAIEAGGVDTVA